MTHPDDPQSGSPFPEDQDAIADAIEERIERLRRLHGWASDTRTVPAQEVEAVVEALDGEIARSKASESVLTLRYDIGAGPQKYELTEERCDIGSGDRATVRVLHPSVSSRHCRIARDGDGFRIRDMNSQTGTFVNDSRIPLSSPLEDGDTLRCGDVEFNVSIATAYDAPEEAPQRERRGVADEAKDGEAESTLAIDLGQVAKGRRSRVAETGSRGRAAAAPEPEAPAPAAARAPAAPAPAAAPAPVDADAQAAPGAREAIVGAPSASFIVYFDANGTEAEIEIPKDRPLVVGRRSTTDLRLIDRSLSSMHAAFEWVEGQVVVRDLGSTNGTWVHGERVPRAVLEDQAVVRLGLVPVRVRFVATPGAAAEAVEPAQEAPSRTRAVSAEGPVEEGPASWHLLFVTDRGAVTSLKIDDEEPCVVAGDGPVEISVQGRGLKPEHLQFDWTGAGLEVMQTRRDAILKVNGDTVVNAALQGGDTVAAGSLIIRVVRGPLLSGGAPPAGHSPDRQRWARHLHAGDPELELLFIDPEAAGGRAELSIWGDGASQVELHTGASQDRNTATVAPELQRVLLDALVRAGFPELPPETSHPDAGGPELYAFWAEERAELVLSDAVVRVSSTWREVRDLLRAIVDHIIG